MKEDFLSCVGAWLAVDPDEDDRATLERLLDDCDETELRRRFDPPLTFGTAGLRGPVMAGPAGMNRCTVRRATQGVIAWLHETGVDPARGVVVGRDARHGSEDFNDEVVAVSCWARACASTRCLAPYPLRSTAFVSRSLGAAAAIMITASHNPPADNGYKLYGPDGSQIVAPHDAIVERHANTAGTAQWAERSSPLHHVVDQQILNRYIEHMSARFGVLTSALSIAYTPLHGVGGRDNDGAVRSIGLRTRGRGRRAISTRP